MTRRARGPRGLARARAQPGGAPLNPPLQQAPVETPAEAAAPAVVAAPPAPGPAWQQGPPQAARPRATAPWAAPPRAAPPRAAPPRATAPSAAPPQAAPPQAAPPRAAPSVRAGGDEDRAARDAEDALNLKSLKSAFESIFQGKPPSLCHRDRVPRGALEGHEIQLVSNMYPIVLPKGKIYHYDVEVSSVKTSMQEGIPEQKRARCASTVINRKVIAKFAQTYCKELGNCLPAYDGRKNMYLRRKLDISVKDKAFTLKIFDNEEEREFVVQLKLASEVSFDALQGMYSQTASKDLFQAQIAAADIILRTGPTLSFVPVGRSFFSDPGPQAIDLSGGREAWTGFYTSIRLGSWKPLVNFDMSTTAFYKAISVVEFAREMFGDRCLQMGLSDRDRVALQRELFGLRVTHRHLHPKRTHRVERLSLRGANRESFECDGQQVTVADYFAKKYQIRLQYPQLQCLVERRGAMVPMELCSLAPGQHCRKKLSEIQTSKLIRSTASDPRSRFQRVAQAAQSTQRAAKPYLDEFAMKIDTQPVELKGRVLPAPRISNSQQGPALTPQDGCWNNKQFLQPGKLQNWAIATHGARVNVKNVADLMVRQARAAGIHTVTQPKVFDFHPNTPERSMLEQVKNTGPVDITVVVLGRSTNYSVVKAEAETSDLNMRTQCVKELKLNKSFNNSFADNLLLKINTKCGGTNWRINPQDRPQRLQNAYMIVGADVNHPAPGDSTTPSVAAVVASLDASPNEYYTTTSVQMKSPDKNRIEYIVDIQNMFLECLQAFQRRNKCLPRIIYFYRDGVADTQLDAVRYHEMGALRAACGSISPDYTPPITFIVVQKRHHIRFRPKNDRDGTTRARNIPSGTVVDSDMVHPVFLDFYLCSQQGPMGTSVPAHYHVVHDDANHTLAELEKLSYYLCFAYMRCPKAVSIPAPVYYAHLAAQRAKEYIKARIYGGSSAGSVSSGSEKVRSLSEFAAAQRVAQSFKGQMYYV